LATSTPCCCHVQKLILVLLPPPVELCVAAGAWVGLVVDEACVGTGVDWDLQLVNARVPAEQSAAIVRNSRRDILFEFISCLSFQWFYIIVSLGVMLDR
jgi:hypothetical protein